MSSMKSFKTRSKTNYNSVDDVSTENLKTEVILEDVKTEIKVKRPIVATNVKIYYPCQYCCKIFSKKLTSISHMKKCPKNLETLTVLNENLSGMNNNDIQQRELHSVEDLNNSTCIENRPPESKPMILNDTSIYDYNEPDDDVVDRDLKENEALNDRQCKHCKTLFDTPLDLLRHTRDCHNFPRTILPPDEIERYFDYPNRQFCPICEKPIKTRNFRSVFIKHLLVHTTGLTHECKVCKKKFRRRDHMRAHEKRHIV